jgi:toxin ParE1/3/4
MAFRVSKDAERDLDGIFLYWAKRAGLNVADRIIDNITDRFWLVGEHPEAGRASEEIAHGVRCFPAGKYLIYYRRTRACTEILHIFHRARDQGRVFKKAKHR